MDASSSLRRWCVLSGAGAGLWWHVGALQALERAGLHFSRWSGTSAGALVATAAAAGRLEALAELAGTLGADELWGERWWPGQLTRRLVRTWRLEGWLSRFRLAQLVDEVLPDEALEKIEPGSLEVVLTDAAAGFESVVVHCGAPPWILRRAILASAAIPGAFAPIELPWCGRRVLGVDGGTADNLPAERAAHWIRAHPDCWELWLLAATARPVCRRPANLGELLEDLVARQLWDEGHRTIQAYEQLGLHRGRDLHVLEALGLEISLGRFTRADARAAYELGLHHGAAIAALVASS